MYKTQFVICADFVFTFVQLSKNVLISFDFKKMSLFKNNFDLDLPHSTNFFLESS